MTNMFSHTISSKAVPISQKMNRMKMEIKSKGVTVKSEKVRVLESQSISKAESKRI